MLHNTLMWDTRNQRDARLQQVLDDVIDRIDYRVRHGFRRLLEPEGCRNDNLTALAAPFL